MEKIKKLHYKEHVKNGLSYKEIQNKYNIPRGTWTYWVNKYNLKCGKRKHRMYDDYFEKIDTSNKAYILGFLYADGCVTENKRICVLLNEKKKMRLM